MSEVTAEEVKAFLSEGLDKIRERMEEEGQEDYALYIADVWALIDQAEAKFDMEMNISVINLDGEELERPSIN